MALFRVGFSLSLVVPFPPAVEAQTGSGQIESGFGEGEVVVVPPDTILAAMQREASRGYDVVPVPNAGRFFAGVVLDLARRAHAENPVGPVLKLNYNDWYEAFLEVANLRPEEAPIAKRIAFEHHQDVFLNYRVDEIIEELDPDETLEFALNVEISWPDGPGSPEKYSFDDTTSVPEVQVTNHQVVRFKLLDLGDMIVIENIEGITGRPSTGILAALFSVIGEGSLKWSRMVVTDDGILIGRAQAKKMLFTVTETVTVFPDGRAMKGLPEDRPDLRPVEQRLMEELDFEYTDW